jgi:hypothetical protein
VLLNLLVHLVNFLEVAERERSDSDGSRDLITSKMNHLPEDCAGVGIALTDRSVFVGWEFSLTSVLVVAQALLKLLYR